MCLYIYISIELKGASIWVCIYIRLLIASGDGLELGTKGYSFIHCQIVKTLFGLCSTHGPRHYVGCLKIT